ncbi:MAG: Hsp20 family protein, partial [Deltaproteobacteria bacterium]
HHICPTNSETTKIIQCHHHNFSREFNFPTLINPKNIDAYYQNGVLRIGIPKNTLVTKQSITVHPSPFGVFSPNKSHEMSEPIESFSDIDDYDWE